MKTRPQMKPHRTAHPWTTQTLRLVVIAAIASLFGLLNSNAVVANSISAASESEVNEPRLPLQGHGMLFIDGHYVEPPYSVEPLPAGIRINNSDYDLKWFGITIETDASKESQAKPKTNGKRGFVKPPLRRRFNAAAAGFQQAGNKQARSVEQRAQRESEKLYDSVIGAQLGGVVIMHQGLSPLLLQPNEDDFHLIRLLKACDLGAAELPSGASGEAPKETWKQFVSTFQPSPELQDRATALLDRLEAAEENANKQTQATLLATKLSFPLTVAAMIFVVLAFGHLLNNRPTVQLPPLFTFSGQEANESEAVSETAVASARLIQFAGGLSRGFSTAHAAGGLTAGSTSAASGGLFQHRQITLQDWFDGETRKVVGRSVLLIGILSLLDLVTTIVTSQAGMMREMNPLGDGLLGDGLANNLAAVTFFKITVTGLAITILFSLRRRAFAQSAAWWCCLIMTLLTARWVIFQSMFM